MKKHLVSVAFSVLMALSSYQVASAYPHDVYCDDAFASSDYAAVISACGQVYEEAYKVGQNNLSDSDFAYALIAESNAALRIGWAYARRGESEKARWSFEDSRAHLDILTYGGTESLSTNLRELITATYQNISLYEKRFL